MILYLDPFMGIAGDMTVSALVDLGADPKAVNAALRALGLEGLAFSFQEVRRQGLRATYGTVAMPHEHPHRGLSDILALLEKAALEPAVRERAAAVFTRLAHAEATVHGCPVEKVHFHEVGAADALADVVGACAALEALGSPAVECGPLNLGSGFTVMEHGTFPVPPPAVVELVKGVPTFAFGAPIERTTPTGAALATTWARRFGSLPEGRIQKVGYGAGTKETEGAPNVLRALLVAEEPHEGVVAVLESHLDDMTPQLLAGALEALREMGAKDLTCAPVQGKKGRSGWMVTLLCDVGREREFAEALLAKTSTIGVRFSRWQRLELPRRILTIETPYGPVRVKEVTLPDGATRRHPEWEDIRALSHKNNISELQLLANISQHISP